MRAETAGGKRQKEIENENKILCNILSRLDSFALIT